MKVMKKDNSTIKASEGLARELALQGYEEVKAAEAVADEPAEQPVPYDKEDIKEVEAVNEEAKPEKKSAKK